MEPALAPQQNRHNLQPPTIATFTRSAQIPSIKRSATIFTKEPTVRIQCLSGSMLVTIKDAPANLNGQFSGMVYPKGLAKNSTCLTEYRDQEGPLRYKLPLKSCNTMPIETILDKRDVVIVGETGMQMKQMHRVKVVALTNFMEVFF
ncbi:conserved hypothetical protein [Culex quinquefasciatus]|uniref:ZP domain-containing protein n=1 Tax=Culex quinquefasciatus TaxID=7176 RepID=B0WCP5_CULQU|nr:conserved hypothetical protein [Culex quinquefasciatus]|eukprot:XP_001846479.1 conserved hypothetical protein [Culex quinquefasciatus]